MSIPKDLRSAEPVEGHGYKATLDEFYDLGIPRPAPNAIRWMARDLVRGCGDCQAHNLYRARLSRMRTAYGKRTR